MHRGIYRRLEAGAVVHVHSPWVTTLAVLGRPLPPVHYMLALAGGTVPVAEYATYGIAELAANAVEAMAAADATACILANHGLVAYTDAPDPAAALETAVAVESVARVISVIPPPRKDRRVPAPSDIREQLGPVSPRHWARL